MLTWPAVVFVKAAFELMSPAPTDSTCPTSELFSAADGDLAALLAVAVTLEPCCPFEAALLIITPLETVKVARAGSFRTL